MGKTHRFRPSTPVKSLKKAAREEFGFEPTKISSNRTRYSRSREKRYWKQNEDSLTYASV